MDSQPAVSAQGIHATFSQNSRNSERAPIEFHSIERAESVARIVPSWLHAVCFETGFR
jgi:hypothetical protein